MPIIATSVFQIARLAVPTLAPCRQPCRDDVVQQRSNGLRTCNSQGQSLHTLPADECPNHA
jgi:hypothetical protein